MMNMNTMDNNNSLELKTIIARIGEGLDGKDGADDDAATECTFQTDTMLNAASSPSSSNSNRYTDSEVDLKLVVMDNGGQPFKDLFGCINNVLAPILQKWAVSCWPCSSSCCCFRLFSSTATAFNSITVSECDTYNNEDNFDDATTAIILEEIQSIREEIALIRRDTSSLATAAATASSKTSSADGTKHAKKHNPNNSLVRNHTNVEVASKKSPSTSEKPSTKSSTESVASSTSVAAATDAATGQLERRDTSKPITKKSLDDDHKRTEFHSSIHKTIQCYRILEDVIRSKASSSNLNKSEEEEEYHGTTTNKQKKKTRVDHNHTTGTVGGGVFGSNRRKRRMKRKKGRKQDTKKMMMSTSTSEKLPLILDYARDISAEAIMTNMTSSKAVED